MASSNNTAPAPIRHHLPPFPSQIDLLTATIQELQGHLSSGLITSPQLTREYLNRIERNNDKGLKLRAVIDVAPRENVMRLAKDFDEMRAKGIHLGDLHGIPILVKDTIATDPALGMLTTAGSVALVKSIPKGDATVVAKLRAKGAIIIGKSNLTEFGNYKGKDTPWGWCSKGGQTQSAYGPGAFPGDICTGGSSSGSAVGVSAGLAAGAIGIETDGAIVDPASRAALYGIKASVGLVPREGILPLSWTADSVGPLAKSAYDAASLLSAMVGCDAHEPAAVHTRGDYTQFTKGPMASFSGKRLGVPRDMFFEHQFWTDPAVYFSKGPRPEWSKLYMHQSSPEKVAIGKRAFDQALAKMAALGAVIVDPADVNIEPHVSYGFEALGIVYGNEFKEGIAKYLEDMASTEMRTLQDIIDFNNSHADVAFGKEGPDAGQICLTDAQNTKGTGSQEYKDALETVQKVAAQGMTKVLDDLKLDAIVLPSACWLTTGFPCISGSPIANVPLGQWESGEPYGLSFLGRKWSEPTLIGLMAAYETHFPPRAVPAAPELVGTAAELTTEF